jgi:hypothetical protein
MAYLRATDPPPRFQWERWDSEPPNGAVNCNPSSAAFILGFYKDYVPSINGLRRLAGVPDYQTVSTTAIILAWSLRGLPSYRARLTIAQLTSLVSSGRRPVLVGLWMGRIPYAQRGYSFTGMHGVAVLANQTRNGVPGKIYMDPNFNPWGGRPDPYNGKRWLSDSLISYAMHERVDPSRVSYSVVPTNAKVISTTVPSFLGYIVVIEGASRLNGYRVGANCSLTPAPMAFGGGSFASVARGSCGGRTYWKITQGGYAGISLVCGLTGVGWHIARRYQKPDGTRYNIRIACTGS